MAVSWGAYKPSSESAMEPANRIDVHIIDDDFSMTSRVVVTIDDEKQYCCASGRVTLRRTTAFPTDVFAERVPAPPVAKELTVFDFVEFQNSKEE